MATINASDEAYKKILKRKQMIEFAQQRLVSMSEALDVLLGVKEDV
jgi:predicted CopG family antitoxin